MAVAPGTIAKLQALMNRLTEALAVVQRSRGREHDRNYFDPADVGEWYARWEAIRTALTAEDPDLADLPARGAPPVEANVNFDRRGHVNRVHVERMLKDMRDAMDVLSHPARTSPQLAIDRGGVFVAGQPFDAMLAVTSIIRAATRSITVVDGYASERILNLLGVKAEPVAARIMTHPQRANPAFVDLARAFNRQYGGGPPLEVRTTRAFHDRFIAVDDVDYYHFGASIDGAANRNAFMFSRIEEPALATAAATLIADSWTTGTVVTL